MGFHLSVLAVLRLFLKQSAGGVQLLVGASDARLELVVCVEQVESGCNQERVNYEVENHDGINLSLVLLSGGLMKVVRGVSGAE
jgi:hypothetical protein